MNAYELAHLAGVASPDTPESPGAHFLERVESDYQEHRKDGTYDPDDSPHDIADVCVPIYTYEVWQTFVDLAAWQEDPTELGADAGDMEQAAKVCLYLIAERLVYALAEADEEAEEEDEEEEEEA